ncbi:hypothetical protein GQ53DRAFT_360501 [Thozetella sp. PMI_491]|nr:hypothetical protein GQ53DRAFT_360501 [Thozetella sp. PMI_491]
MKLFSGARIAYGDAALLAILAFVPACAASVNVDWDCQANPPIGSSQQLSLGSTIDGQAPTSVLPGDVFEIVLAPEPLAIPGSAAGYHLNNLRNVKLSIPVPAGTTFNGVTLTGGSSTGGTPSVAQSGGVITLSVPGKISGGSTFQFPALHLSLIATGAAGTTIIAKAAGTSYGSPGLQFTANVNVSPGIDVDVPAKCFPNPSPTLTTTTVNKPGSAPITHWAPALASSGNRTMALATGTDGRIFQTWWDLGGGGNGWREVPPGGLNSDVGPGAAMVFNGKYAFILAKRIGGDIFLNQGIPGGAWVGWQSLGIVSNVSPTATSYLNRTLTLVTATDGRVMHDWSDLGGGGQGWREVPGNFRTNLTVAASLTNKGGYAFILGRASDGTVFIQQGNLGAAWVGWTAAGITTNVAPTACSYLDRTVAFVTTTDGRIMSDWWDLGGGRHGWREIPGGVRTDVSVGAGLVDNGRYVFVMAKDANGFMQINQGDPTTGVWIGWQSV